MLSHLSYTLLVTNHVAELARHSRSARLRRINYPDRERSPRILRHWTNR